MSFCHPASMTALVLLVASGHTGVPRVRTAPEASDVALFVLAVLAVWFVRRRLRARFHTRDQRPPTRRD